LFDSDVSPDARAAAGVVLRWVRERRPLWLSWSLGAGGAGSLTPISVLIAFIRDVIEFAPDSAGGAALGWAD